MFYAYDTASVGDELVDSRGQVDSCNQSQSAAEVDVAKNKFRNIRIRFVYMSNFC